MTSRLEPRSARLSIAVALPLGLLADLLLREAPWGLNATFWFFALAASAMALRRHIAPDASAWPLVLAGLFALGFLLRDSPTLLVLFVFAILAAWATALLDGPARAGVLSRVLAVFVTAVHAMVLSALVLRVARPEGAAGKSLRPFATVAVGVLLAVPFLVVFGALFASADPLFARYVLDLFHAIDDAFEHLATILLVAWMACGLLVGLGWIRLPGTLLRSGRGRLGGEILVALGLVDILFLTFIAVQFRALFGGHAYVAATTGLSYAAYAREGFFELVTCAAISLPMLLASDWAIPQGAPARRRFIVLSTALAIMVVAVLASAARRMSLYVDAYGLTELRLYSSAFMVWLALVVLVFGVTILRGARERFAIGALAAAWALLVGLAVLDPDATIVRVNAARARYSTTGFDAHYATSLSADSVPALLEVLPALDLVSRCVVAERLLARWDPRADSDWRTWNLSRWRAQRSVAAARDELRAVAEVCPRPPPGERRA